ncbi:MAG: MgtC/SapB family protein [Alphaproteobacteria bacterium]|nr:MgtC/SapB family protein [Alphaproteobacteria bacterium]
MAFSGTESFFDSQLTRALCANAYATVNIVFALFLGVFVGYERAFRGRAAGMRTYGLVCMSSCALVVLGAHPEAWFGGQSAENLKYVDPSRIIQGISTGIGFLGAGVIMRDGFNISGLTTAASIWTVATIGVLVGIGFYGPATVLAVIAVAFMMWGAKIESMLPGRHAVAITLTFGKAAKVTEEDVARLMREKGYKVADSSFTIDQCDGRTSWRFVAVSRGRHRAATMVKLGDHLRRTEGIDAFTLALARN